MSLLSIEGLTVALPKGGDRPHALREVTLELNPNEILCVVGESGSGKSMTASAVMGLLPEGVRAEAGRVVFEGRDLLALPEPDLRKLRGARIGMVFQEPMTALNPLRTFPVRTRGARHLAAAAGAHPRARRRREGFPARAVRRPAAARHDRHGTGAGPRAADLRRTNHGAGRHDTGADPGVDP
jgi:peptide/nickel transport system ATP-binding protein